MNTTGFNTRQLGQEGEQVAEAFLRQRGYRILEKNYRNTFGEIDLIAEEDGTLVFVEVKKRRKASLAPPEASVDFRKQHRLYRVALGYLSQRRAADRRCRFDVVSICGEQVQLFQNAFEVSG